MVKEVVDVQRITQETYKWCAPACAQMLLHSLGIERTQQSIWDETRALASDPTKWFTDPDALATYLAQFDAIKAKVSIDDVPSEGLETVFSRLIRVLDRQTLPAPILIYGGKHWVLFIGIEGEFLDASRESARVSAIWVADPSRGTSGLDVYPIGDWFRNSFFTPVIIPGPWSGKLVAVTDASADRLAVVELAQSPRPPGGGAGIKLTLADISEVLAEDIAHFALGNTARIARVDDSALTGDMRMLALVSALGLDQGTISPLEVTVIEDGSVYYLSPTMLDKSFTWSAISANYLGLAAMRMGFIQLPPTGAELEAVVRTRLGNIGAYEERPGLFWTSCAELRSLFDVVRIVTVDGVEYFVDAYNNVLDQLTTGVAG